MKLKFEPLDDATDETRMFYVKNRKGELLGTIYYELRWKEFVWQQADAIIMSESCLMQVVNKLRFLSQKGDDVEK